MTIWKNNSTLQDKVDLFSDQTGAMHIPQYMNKEGLSWTKRVP